MRLEDVKLGRYVTYTPFAGCDPSLKEEGMITSVNDKFVFVRYGNDANSKATNPEDLEYSIRSLNK